MARRAVCPVCSNTAAVNTHGRLMKHGRRRDLATGKPYGSFCAGTDRKVLEDRVPRGICRVCHEEHATDLKGMVVLHGYKKVSSEDPCPGSYLKAQEEAS